MRLEFADRMFIGVIIIHVSICYLHVYSYAVFMQLCMQFTCRYCGYAGMKRPGTQHFLSERQPSGPSTRTRVSPYRQ